MPVLMNKGGDPRQAAWLFYTARPVLDELGQAIRSQRFDAGRIAVDEAELAGAKKANSEVGVYLDVTSLVPEDFDLDAALEKARAQAQAAAEAAQAGAEADGETGAAVQADEAADETRGAGNDAQASEDDAQAATSAEAGDTRDNDAQTSEDGKLALPYEPVILDEPIRVEIGRTTAQAARAYLVPREGDEDKEVRATELPGLQALAQLIGHMRDSSFGVPAQAVWHVDPQGILRMAPAKTVKPMAGNVLKVKL